MNMAGYGTAKEMVKKSKTESPDWMKNKSDDDPLEDMDEAHTEYMKRRITMLMQAQS